MACEAEQAAVDNESSICAQLLVDRDDKQAELAQIEADYNEHYANLLWAIDALNTCQGN